LTPPEAPRAFAEPWQAQAFALVLALVEAGKFDWGAWTASLAAELARREGDGVEIDEDRYFEAWLAALEQLTQASGLVSASQLSRRADAWREAYLRTPHGQPVELGA
jgi:nitrile hydratase accessory protein